MPNRKVFEIDSAQADICEKRVFQQHHYQWLTPNFILKQNPQIAYLPTELAVKQEK
jgi:hypothetical protein